MLNDDYSQYQSDKPGPDGNFFLGVFNGLLITGAIGVVLIVIIALIRSM